MIQELRDFIVTHSLFSSFVFLFMLNCLLLRLKKISNVIHRNVISVFKDLCVSMLRTVL